MSKKVINEQTMTDIADAIREKLETSDKFHPSEMPGAIHRIKGGIAEWERPSEWPNLDSLDLSDYEDVFVITLDNTKRDAWFSVKASTSAGSGTIILFEQGTVIDGEFVLEKTWWGTKGSTYRCYIESQYDYPVIMVSSPVYTMTSFGYDSAPSISGQTGMGGSLMPVMELRAKINNVSNITSNKIANYNTQHIVIENMTKVTSLASAFANCYSLQKIEFKNCDTKAVTNMSSTFQYCYSLSDFSFLDDFDTSSCVNMTAFLMACAGLTEFDASRLDFSSCTNISSFLSGCYNLKSASFKGTDLSKVTTIASLFQNCYKLENIDLSDVDLTQVTTMSNTFGTVNALRDVKLSPVSVAFSLSTQCISKETLIGIIDVLPEVDGITITLGNNKQKLTTEEKQPLLDKGWKIA